MSAATKEQRHRQRMLRKKEVVDKAIAEANEERGLLLVLTGNGKGKSSSAFGMVARALGHDMKVGVVQFIKGTFATGEEAFFRRFDSVDYRVMGEGFTWETQDRGRDMEAAAEAWGQSCRMLSDPAYHLVVLDELNIALKYGYVDLDSVMDALRRRPEDQHVVVTGRGAPKELVDLADTVTNMDPIKHAFQAGLKAQKGVEL